MSRRDRSAVNDYIQAELRRQRLLEVSAVEAARWLDRAGLLADSERRPGKPLRELLRGGLIDGADQRPATAYGRWFIMQDNASSRPTGIRPPEVTGFSPSADRAPSCAPEIRGGSDLADAAMHALADAPKPIELARDHVPASPGLYAIHGDRRAWADLGLGAPPDSRPLYIGKAEASLIARDFRTHFGDGRTGSSTVRRSLAALLADTLGLRAIPRNPARPERPANFGLPPDCERELGAWMARHLMLATWAKPRDCESLIAVERVLLDRLHPPLNLQDNDSPWKRDLLAARGRMADQVRAQMGSAGIGEQS